MTTTNKYIRKWGIEDEDTIEKLERELIDHNCQTRDDLRHLLALTSSDTRNRRYWDDEIEDYKTELEKLVVKYDSELYEKNPTQYEIIYRYFTFNPYSDEIPKFEHIYDSIYEYVDYLETAIKTLQPKKYLHNKKLYNTDDLRHGNSYYRSVDIRQYAKVLEEIAWEYDAYVMSVYDERDWYNPLRRIPQMELKDAINLLEFYLRATYTERQLNKIYNQRISDESYLLTLTQMTHHLTTKKK
jgi:hypothetical protein